MEYDTILNLAYEAYFDCRQNKRRKYTSIHFNWNYEEEIGKLVRELCDKTYHPTTSVVFPVTSPKHREVFAADFRDRVVHHLLMRQFGDILDTEMISDSYNCRKGMGVFYGQKRLEEELHRISKDYTRNAYVLSGDIEGFFMSIDVDRLWQMLEVLIRDKYAGEDMEWWLWLFELVIKHRPETDCTVHGDKAILDALPDNKTLMRNGGKGMPIGNYYVQITGNYYLTPFDRMMQHVVGSDGFYCRFVDDFKVVSTDKRLLRKVAIEARRYLKDNLGLRMHHKKFSITEIHKGVNFIGCVIKPWGRYSSRRLVGNAMCAFRRSNQPIERIIASYNSYMGFLTQSKSYAIRWQLWKSKPQTLKDDIVCINMRKFALRDDLDNIHAMVNS
jgi:hypothetical protein